ncbi:NAD(P)-dependent oxidoreductase [Microbispora sp. CA-102843]|uniref:NAD(P)-dependent oxidoreductase n=1 Tax=Microbispora sp. CA-102843 TaxID=3239952 RepID=UPI003D91F3E0
MSGDRDDLALIGLGNMGMPMAERWLKAGHVVHGFDVDAEARDRLAAGGGIAHQSAAEAAATAAVTVLMLPSTPIVDRVLGELCAAGALRAGTTVIDMSSSEPLASQRNAGDLAGIGVHFLDAPVSGGVRGAESGSLTIMVGGEPVWVESCRPLLASLGKVIPVGPVGAGHAVKALNNLLSATHLWITSEAVLIGERLGIAPATILEVFNGSSGRSGSSEVKWPQFIASERYDSGFEARLMLKDAKIATQLARGLGLPTSLGEGVVDLWAQATDDLPPRADHTEIARWLKERAT